MAGAAGPVALFSLGLTMTRFRVRGDMPVALAISALALVVQPVVVFMSARCSCRANGWR